MIPSIAFIINHSFETHSMASYIVVVKVQKFRFGVNYLFLLILIFARLRRPDPSVAGAAVMFRGLAARYHERQPTQGPKTERTPNTQIPTVRHSIWSRGTVVVTW